MRKKFETITIKTWPVRCVKCGIALRATEFHLMFSSMGLPSCAVHSNEVVDEQGKDFSMYPSTWYGHAIASDDGTKLTIG